MKIVPRSFLLRILVVPMALIPLGRDASEAAGPPSRFESHEPSLSASGVSHTLEWSAVSGSAAQWSGGGYILRGTVGEVGVVGYATGAGLQLGQGFWARNFWSLATEVPGDLAAHAVTVNGFRPACPNPFRGETSIAYSIARESPVRLTVFDVTGRRVSILVDRHQSPGQYTAWWDGRDSGGASVASGVYFYRLDVGEWSSTEAVLKIH